MRIVHVIDYYQPQLGYQEAFLAREQVKLGHEVHVITSDRYAPHPHYETTWQPVLGPRLLKAGVYSDDNVTIHRLRVRFEIGVRIWLNGLEKRILELEPDLVHVHGMTSFTAVRILRISVQLRAHGRLLYDSHANEVNSRHSLRQMLYYAYRLGLANSFVERSDAIVAIDNASYRFLVEQCGISENKIHIIPMGADPDLFRRDENARYQLRSRLGFCNDDIVVIYAGKVQHRKGVHLLVDAVIELVRKDAHVKALIVGSGDDTYIEAMKGRIAQVGMDENFRWVGLVPNRELYQYYSAADISVWPLEVSIGTLEAQACGLPLVVANTPVLRDRAKYSNGLIYEAVNVRDLVAKIELLANHPQLRRKMGENGRRYIETELSWKAIAQRFIDLVY